MKSLVADIRLPGILICLFFSAAVFAIDTDGDGFDDVGAVLYSTSFGTTLGPEWSSGGTYPNWSIVDMTSTPYWSRSVPYVLVSWMPGCIGFCSLSTHTEALTYTTTQSSTISFWALSDDPTDYHVLDFLIDNVSQGKISLNHYTWTQVQASVPAGEHVFKWVTISDSPKVYVDDVSITSVKDNCPAVANPNQLDSDGDGVGDACDCYPYDASQSACPSGDYATGTGFAIAPAGSYASNNALTQCSAGTYNPDTGSTSSAACLADPVGTWSFAGAASYTYDTAVANCTMYSSMSDACTSCATGYALSGGQCSLLAHVKNDFNGDGKSDVLFLDTTTGATRYWTDAAKSQSIYVGTYSTSYTYAGSGDFDGDGKADLLFVDTTTNTTQIWPGANKSAMTYPGAGAAGYSVAATCDTDGDGKDDIVWYNPSTGSVRIWPDASKAAVKYPGIQNTAFAIVACADFDGDGKSDLFWRNAATGADQVWLGGQKSNMLYPGANTDLTVVAVGANDTDGDGKADMVWYTPSTGAVRVWSGGLKSASAYIGTGASGFTPKALGDYDGDGKADLMWGNDTTLATQIWPALVKANVMYLGTSPAGFSVQK